MNGAGGQGGGLYSAGLREITNPFASVISLGSRHCPSLPSVIDIPELQAERRLRAMECLPGGVARKICFPGSRRRTTRTAGTRSPSALMMMARSNTLSIASSTKAKEKWTSVSFSSCCFQVAPHELHLALFSLNRAMWHSTPRCWIAATYCRCRAYLAGSQVAYAEK